VAPGYTFTPGQSISHVELNAAAAGSINTSFFTGKSAVTAPDTAGLVLLWDATSTDFRKATLLNAFFNHDFLINGRTAENFPTNGDFVLFYDNSAGGYRKTTLDQLVFTNVSLIDNRLETTNPAVATTYFVTSSNGVYYKISAANLLAMAPSNNLVLSNLTLKAGLTNNDLFFVASTNGTNYSVTYSGLITNNAVLAVASVAGADQLVVYNVASNTPYKLPLTNLANAVSNWVSTNVFPKAWAKIDGQTTGSNAPVRGYNVAGIERLGTGHYRAWFTSNLLTTNYVVEATAYDNTASSVSLIVTNQTVSNVTLRSATAAGAAADRNFLNLLLFE